MMQTPIIPRKIYAGSLAAVGIFLLYAAVVLLSSFLLRPAMTSGDSKASSLLQENIGYRIQVVDRYDQERQARLQEQWARVVQQVGRFEHGRKGRLQEALGRAIAQTSQKILMEQIRLRNAVIEAAQEVQKFQREKSARRQEQLGTAILEAARRAPEGGGTFQAVFQKKANLLKKITERTGRHLEAHLQALLTRQAEFPSTIPFLYQEAIQSTRRSARMLDESQAAWMSRVLNELRDQLVWRRQPEDYMRLAAVAGEVLPGLPQESESEGYGFYALAGLILAMLWVASITRGDNLGSKTFESQKRN